MSKNGKTFVIWLMLFILAVLVFSLFLMNRWIESQQPLVYKTSFVPYPKQESAPQKKITREVIKKTWLDPNRAYTESVFYIGDQEIARHKVSNGKVFDQKGEIPDGRVKFFDDSQATYGEEHYKRGRLHGSSRTYYKSGQLKREVYYIYGNVQVSKEYYEDGILRMEEDYTDARNYGDDREVGTGKLYYTDGTLKYEWHHTISDETGFNKSYDYKGQLAAEFYYDVEGNCLLFPEISFILKPEEGI